MHFLSFPVLPEEKKAKFHRVFVGKLPNALAALAYSQVKKIQKYNTKRAEITRYYIAMLGKYAHLLYEKADPLLRFPITIEKRDEILALLKKHGVYLGTWYANVIDPKGVDFDKVFYKRGSCPNAEKIAGSILNLPTYPTMILKDAKKVVTLLKQYATR